MSFFRRLRSLFGKPEPHAVAVHKLLTGKHPETFAFLRGCQEAGVRPDYKQGSKWLNRYGAAYQAWERRAA